jgi:hypothetical protein
VDNDLFSIIVGVMHGSLALTGSARTEAHGLTIELVLALVRNLLAVLDDQIGAQKIFTATVRFCDLSCSVSFVHLSVPGSSVASTHERLLCVLHDELMLDIVLLLAQVNRNLTPTQPKRLHSHHVSACPFRTSILARTRP